jgi:hypothetical protein
MLIKAKNMAERTVVGSYRLAIDKGTVASEVLELKSQASKGIAPDIDEKKGNNSGFAIPNVIVPVPAFAFSIDPPRRDD